MLTSDQVGPIRVEDIAVTFEGKQGSHPVLEGINFTVDPGEFVAIIGPSGCGKSTLLRVIAGLLQPSAGRVRFGDTDSSAQRIGFLFQTDSLLPWKTAVQNVALAVKLGGGESAGAVDVAQQLMASLGLADSEDKYPRQLSGGMRKRVALARTLAYQPSVFLLDEPFSALDAQTRVTVGNFFLKRLEERGQSVIVVTHDIEEAVTMADRVIVLSKPPSTVQIIHDIPIPRPRDYYQSRFDDSFPAHQRVLWDALGYGREDEEA